MDTATLLEIREVEDLDDDYFHAELAALLPLP